MTVLSANVICMPSVSKTPISNRLSFLTEVTWSSGYRKAVWRLRDSVTLRPLLASFIVSDLLDFFHNLEERLRRPRTELNDISLCVNCRCPGIPLSSAKCRDCTAPSAKEAVVECELALD